MPYYTRESSEPPVDELHALLRRAQDDFDTLLSRVESLLSEIDQTTAYAVRTALYSVTVAYRTASEHLYDARSVEAEG